MWLIPQKETTTSPERWEWFNERYTQRMQNVLFAEAVRILGSRDDAQDVMQEAVLRGVTYCWQLRDEEKLFQWMFTIVRNLCFDICYHCSSCSAGGERRNAAPLRIETTVSGGCAHAPLFANTRGAQYPHGD